MGTERVLFVTLALYFLVSMWFFIDLSRREKKLNDHITRLYRRFNEIEQNVQQVKLATKIARNAMQDDIKGLRNDVDHLVEDLAEPAKENAAAEARVLQGLENLLDYNPEIARKAVKGDV